MVWSVLLRNSFLIFFFFFCFDFGLDAEKSVEPEEDLRFDCFWF